ncbi:MAG: Rid family detoxifying hydrolase [Atopobiaceae bacterium]|jgi:2-iminobutanoate/2-iminopropanoate deaminase|nr:Rid family detoxifying hydrolase [Atopobiaceae bacterium]MCH4179992.1 Rid family detoxifying hydrolase [Atopobiaceae bacterium]MCH4213956.1 Rid family detoxifying hydrolase [Atopobiaceae bacterium]MCH4230182.1 Rid family detoxifying hydrolase [Atopobiaceae bacterium]MCH4275581.1 Rid family detoxifying hydrolase [Atopobiaceae bacterium]
MKYPITADDAPKAQGPFSQGTTAARYAFVSGQSGVDPATGSLVSGGIGAQTARALANVSIILEDADLTLEDVTKVTVYLADITSYDEMNEVYAERFPAPYPARTVVGVAGLVGGGLVEIECVACR